MTMHDTRTRIGARGASRTAAVALAAAACLQPAAAQLFTYDEVLHVTNQLTFGPTQAEIASATGGPDVGYFAWLNRQLNPATVTQHVDLAPALAGLQLPASQGAPTSLVDIQKAQLVHAFLSTRQLQEVMAYFWEIHFNTNWYSINSLIKSQMIVTALEDEVTSWLEWDDNQFYRANALGTFRDLLVRTTESPGMMLYLNLNQSRGCPNPNENYAREFLELYSMSPSNEATGAANYTQADVVEVARAFTGWSLVNTPPLSPTFTFANHCPGTRTIFAGTPHAETIGSNDTGSNQLRDVVFHVAAADATREFICRKLMRFFLADVAGGRGVHTTLVNQMKQAWGAQGNIRNVLEVLLTSPEFMGSTYRWCRVRTPFEKAVWWPRIWDGSLRRVDNNIVDVTKIDSLFTAVGAMGQLPFTFPSPDGFPLEEVEQPGSYLTIANYDYVARLVWEFPAPPSTLNFFPAHPTMLLQPLTSVLSPAMQVSPNAIATLFLNRLYGSKWSSVDHQAVTDGIARDLLGRLLPLVPGNPIDYQLRTSLGATDGGSLIQASLK